MIGIPSFNKPSCAKPEFIKLINQGLFCLLHFYSSVRGSEKVWEGKDLSSESALLNHSISTGKINLWRLSSYGLLRTSANF